MGAPTERDAALRVLDDTRARVERGDFHRPCWLMERVRARIERGDLPPLSKAFVDKHTVRGGIGASCLIRHRAVPQWHLEKHAMLCVLDETRVGIASGELEPRTALPQWVIAEKLRELGA